MTAPATSIALTVNGQRTECTVRPRLLLTELLRDELRLTGTHVGCGTGACGSCTVLLDRGGRENSDRSLSGLSA